MSNGRIVIYDDETRSGEQYLETLNESESITRNFENIESIESRKFLEELNLLKKRQLDLRNGKSWTGESSLFDEISVFIIDYDLVKASDSGSFLTGENVSYYVRCFSKCRIIIGLNQFGTNNFDLSLKGNPESYADLNIGSDQLDNPGLWGGMPDGFRPWCWPDIPGYLSNLAKKIRDLEGNLDEQIFDFFALPEEIIGILPRSVSEFIGAEPKRTTFREFLTESGNGLARKDDNIDNMDEDIQALVIASRISKWLEQLVLPGQNILIDAPHLVQRYPSLLEGDHSNTETWNKTTTFEKPDEMEMDHEKIEEYRFKKDFWLSRPAWFLNGLINCQDIREVTDPWTREPIEFVFCEDSSSFHRKEECREFLAELESPYIRRYVRIFKGVDYTPRVRFSM